MKFSWIVFFAALLLAAIAAFHPTSDPDTFWHLVTGKLALTQPSAIATDHFSYSIAGRPWIHKDLLAEILIAWSFVGLGYFGLFVIKVFAIAPLYLALARRATSRLPAFLLTAAFLAALPISERPLIFSIGCFAWFLVLLDDARRAERSAFSPKRWLIVVAVFYLWIWLHRTALIGLALLAILCAHELLFVLLRRAPLRRALVPAATALACAIVGLLTPSGLMVYTSASGEAQSAANRAELSEWTPLDLPLLLRAFPVTAALLGCAFVTLAWTLQRGRRDDDRPLDLFHALILLALTVMLRDSARFALYATIAACHVLSRAAAAYTATALERTRILRPLLFVAAYVLVAFAQRAPFSLGPDATRLPLGAVDFARNNALTGPVVNAFNHGGYLIFAGWPDWKVLVDGRNELIYHPAEISRALRAQRDPVEFAKMRAEDHVTWVLSDNRPAFLTFAFLSRDPRWAMIYWSETAAIFVERSAHPALVAKYAYAHLDASDLPSSVAQAVGRARGDRSTFAALESELTRALTSSPTSVRARAALVVFYHLAGADAHGRRDELMRSLLADEPDHPAVQELSRRLYGR